MLHIAMQLGFITYTQIRGNNMSDTFIAVYSEGELVVSGRREPAGSLAVRALNLPKSSVTAMEALCRRRCGDEQQAAADLELVAQTAGTLPLNDCSALLDDIICFRVYVRRALSLSLSGRGAEDHQAFRAELESMRKQLRREDNLRRTVLSEEISPAVDFVAENGRLCERLTFGSMRELLLFDLLRAMERSRTPRACKCCGEYFVPARSGEVYCTGEAPDGDGKTCREVGARRKFVEKLSGNDILRLYRAACGRVYTRKSRGGVTAADANDMIRACAELRDRALAGEMTIDELGEQLSKATRSR